MFQLLRHRITMAARNSFSRCLDRVPSFLLNPYPFLGKHADLPSELTLRFLEVFPQHWQDQLDEAFLVRDPKTWVCKVRYAPDETTLRRWLAIEKPGIPVHVLTALN